MLTGIRVESDIENTNTNISIFRILSYFLNFIQKDRSTENSARNLQNISFLVVPYQEKKLTPVHANDM